MGVVFNTPYSHLLKGLDPEQVRAVAAPPTPLVVVAGAGSGKTTVLVRRIAMLAARGDVAPKNVLAVSHTTKAAIEIKDRLRRFDGSLTAVSSMTVHAAAWMVVRKFHLAAGFSALPEVLSSTVPLVREAAKQIVAGPLSATELADLAAELEWLAASGLTPESYPAAAAQALRSPVLGFDKVAALSVVVSVLKRERNQVDFGDLLLVATDTLQTNAAIASTVRAGWRAVLVDEYQDTDPAQARFLDAIRCGSPLWTVVGDPRQTVYSFKGADPTLLRAQMRDKSSTVVHLTRSWRCSRQILDWASKLIGTKYGPPLVSDVDGPDPLFLDCKDDEAEAERVVRQLQQWSASGVPFSSQAILFRFNASSAKVEAMLAARNIPFQALGGVAFFERPEVQAAVEEFSAAADLDPDAPALALLTEVVSRLGFDLASPPVSYGRTRLRWESVRALRDLAAGSEDDTAAGVAGLFDELLSSQHADDSGVSIGTIHAAKGLEWDAVLVYGFAEGSLPSVHAKNVAMVEEERRLCYVAMTRARRFLALCYTRLATVGSVDQSSSRATSHKIPQRPSQFAFSIPSVAAALSPAKSASGVPGASRRSTHLRSWLD
jgi:DNA helicase-2/ATP-dependent DNA helicase PcrA